MKNEKINKWKNDKYFTNENCLGPFPPDAAIEKDLAGIFLNCKTTNLPCAYACFRDLDEVVSDYFSKESKSIKREYCDKEIFERGEAEITYQIPDIARDIIDTKIDKWVANGEFSFTNELRPDGRMILLPEIYIKGDSALTFSTLLEELGNDLKNIPIPVEIRQSIEKREPADGWFPPEHQTKGLKPVKMEIPFSSIFTDFRYDFLVTDDYEEMVELIKDGELILLAKNIADFTETNQKDILEKLKDGQVQEIKDMLTYAINAIGAEDSAYITREIIEEKASIERVMERLIEKEEVLEL